MAEFRPFHGIRYSADLIKDYSQVVAPPYDVISPRERDALHERHQYNVVRLILGKPLPSDGPTDNVHSRAAHFFNNWQTDRVLIRDRSAGFYLTSVTFDLDGQRVTRFGIIGMVRLEPFNKGIVLPHERTFSKVKSERLGLMQACHANLCPIFGLYPDPDSLYTKLRAMTSAMPPELKLTDDKGLLHQLWCLTDERVIEDVTHALQDQKIYIADGHHRYETALNYRDWFKNEDVGYTQEHPCNYVMMSLISMNDPGLIILPAHRLLLDVSEEASSRLFEKAQRYFDVQSVALQDDMHQVAARVEDLLKEHVKGNAIGVFVKNKARIDVMALKPGVMNQVYGDQIHSSLLDLDVSVLTHLIMMELLGFDQDRLDDETRITYRTQIFDSLAAVKEGEADLCFLLNPTKIEQVKRVAENGLIMPRKSTYFYPKEISGLVMNAMKPVH